jgi:hypothetical protein
VNVHKGGRNHKKHKMHKRNSSLLCILCFLWFLPLLQSQTLALKRFDVIRADSDGINKVPQSLRNIFEGPVQNLASPVANVEEAARRLGYAPRLPASAKPMELFITDPVRDDSKIAVAELTDGLREAKITDASVPQAWNGVTIQLRQGAGLIADYGEFFIAQSPPMTMSVPDGFPLDQFLEVLLRLAGIPSADARTLRQKFAAGPALYFPIPPRYEMDIKEVRLNSGAGLLLQNADKGGELAFMWSTEDRSFFLSGLMTEDEAIRLANSLR